MTENVGPAAMSMSVHNLPRIPTIGSSPRKAISKASVKHGLDENDQSVKIIGQAIDEKACTPPSTPVNSNAQPPSSMPTPPSEPSPGDEKKLSTPDASLEMSCLDKSLVDPNENDHNALDIEHNASFVSQVETETKPVEVIEIVDVPSLKKETESDVNESIDKSNGETMKQVLCRTEQNAIQPEVLDNKIGRAKTKGDIKKQLQKKRNSKGVESKDSDSTSDNVDVTTLIAKETLEKRKVLLKDETVAGASHLLGDVFWGKVGGHPWWPCMIAYDPFEGVYFRNKGGRVGNEYHVQFFGQEEERAWVSESRLIPYAGREAHLRWLKEMRNKASKSSKKLYEMKSGRIPMWEIACKESERAVKMDRTARRAEFTLVYAEKSKEEETSKGSSDSKSSNKKRKLSHGGENIEKSPPRKKQKRLSTVGNEDSVKSVDPARIRFLVFCTKKREHIRREHPGYTNEKIEKMLKTMWDKLSEDEKLKFIPMGANVKDLVAKSNHEVKTSTKSSKTKADSSGNENGDMKRKRKSTQSTATSGAKSTKSGPEGDLDELLSRVAGGEGDIPDLGGISYVDGELVIDESADLTRKKHKQDNDSSSQTSSKPDSIPPDGQGVMLNGVYFEPDIFSLFSNPSIKKEVICEMCEEDHGDMVSCEGVCQGSYHVSCLGLFKKPAGPFKCDACSSGTHTCFVCKKREDNPRKCSVVSCGKFYHEACLKKFPNARFENGRTVCPLHTCATCAALEKDKDCKGKLYRCVRCPTAYHASDFCIAAGSVNLAGYHIVCSNHFVPVKTQSHHQHVNVSWCFACSLGGSLICCEMCPASYHAQCLNIETPEGAWYCQDCAAGKRPLYGDIVWIKFGSYRWWPGEICHPENVPRNIREKSHQVGEFPIKFFGTGEYTWLHIGRVFMFQEGDKGNKDSASSKTMDKSFRRAMEEANVAAKMVQEFRDRMEEEKGSKADNKPAKYKHIKVNRPFGNVQIYNAELSDIQRCDCDPFSENPCSSDEDCINRMTNFECNPQVCPAGERCQNQRFAKRQYPSARPHRFPDSAGWGLMALEDVKKGQFVCEYVGDLIDPEECRRRIIQMHKDNIDDFYFLTLDNGRIIDAGPRGNLSRFMNHCCDPNCDTVKWSVNGDTRVGLFANQDIAKGAELTFNYNLDCLGNEKKKCHCKAKNCSGFLGLPPKQNQSEEKVKVKKKKKRIPKVKKVYEDECYRCGYGGDLICCDKSSCTKVYHLKCLTIEKIPHGCWICPWHHCDDCGKASVKLCSECPNSFCYNHIEGNIFMLKDSRLICSDHEDILDTQEHSKLGNEPSRKLPSSTSCSENGSTTANSDSESEQVSTASATSTAPLIKTMLKAQLEKKVAEVKSGDKDFLSDSSMGDENHIPVKKRAIHRKLAAADDSSGSTSGSRSPANQKTGSDVEQVSSNGSASPRRKSQNGRRSSTQGKDSSGPNVAKSEKVPKTPKASETKTADSPMFDDTDSDDFPGLVIDIP